MPHHIEQRRGQAVLPPVTNGALPLRAPWRTPGRRHQGGVRDRRNKVLRNIRYPEVRQAVLYMAYDGERDQEPCALPLDPTPTDWNTPIYLWPDPYGRAGKGTLERILRQLVPPTFVTAVSPFKWGEDYHLATLAGSRLNVVGELPDNESIPAAEFKSVLGGDLITGRHPTQQPFSFKSEAAHLFMSNHMINSRDQSEAFFTRWLIVEFPNSRLRSGLAIDPNVADRIIEREVPGIAHWALEGAARLLRKGAFSKSQAHERLMLKWRRGNSSLEEFIHECCILGPGNSVRRAELYIAYRVWCDQNGRKAFAKSRVKELLEYNLGLGIRLASLDGNEIFRGVRVKKIHEGPDGEDLRF